MEVLLISRLFPDIERALLLEKSTIINTVRPDK